MAGELSKDTDVQVEVVRGGLLELSVLIDEQEAIKTNPLWYPMPGNVVGRARELLTSPINREVKGSTR